MADLQDYDPTDKPERFYIVDPVTGEKILDPDGEPMYLSMFEYYSNKGRMARRDHKKRAQKEKPRADDFERHEMIECGLLADVIDDLNIQWRGRKLENDFFAIREFLYAREDVKEGADRFWADRRNFLSHSSVG